MWYAHSPDAKMRKVFRRQKFFWVIWMNYKKGEVELTKLVIIFLIKTPRPWFTFQKYIAIRDLWILDMQIYFFCSLFIGYASLFFF